MRYIDADKIDFSPLKDDFDRARAKVIIMGQPTADVVEVKHGKWILVPSSDLATGKAYKCSECEKMRYGSYMPNYCQCCGAKMDGGNAE